MKCKVHNFLLINDAGQLYYLKCLDASLLCLRAAKNAIIWMVLPRPISSPIIPPADWQCSSQSQLTPTRW